MSLQKVLRVIFLKRRGQMIKQPIIDLLIDLIKMYIRRI